MSDARRDWIASISTYQAQPGNRKAINAQFNQIAAQAQQNNPAPYYKKSRPLSIPAIGQQAQQQDLQLRNATKLGGQTQPFVDVNQTQPLPGQPGYAQLPVEAKPTLPYAFRQAANLRVRKGELKPPAPPKESYERYQQRLAATQKRVFLQNTRAKFEYEQALANYRAAITNIGRNVFANGTAFLDRIPTPGNLRVPFLILFVLFFILVPVNGHTRIGWLWLTFLGDTTISPNTNKYEQPQNLGSIIGGGSGGGYTVKQEYKQSTTGNLNQQWQSDLLPDTVATGYDYMSLYGGIND